jgi:ferric-dicitrate binding protein FerR (iron transport regulator)
MVSWKKLAKYLSGEAAEEDKRLVERWLRRNDKHRKRFEETKMHWNNIENHEHSQVNVDAAWDNLYTRIRQEEGEGYRQPTTRQLSSHLLRYAAVALLLIGLGFGGFHTYQAIQTVSVETPAETGKKQVHLPDGSMAYLNYGSQVNYPKNFQQKDREVEIEKGEVYFDVESDPSRPFIISAQDARIEVLGTSFNVNTNFADQRVEVFVESGKVRLSRKEHPDRFLVLESGYKGILTSSALRKTKSTNSNYIAWATGRLMFKGQPLGEVVKTLKRTYQAEITIKNPEIKSYKITTNFTDEPIDTVLAVIATTFNLEVESNSAGSYVISKTKPVKEEP